MGKFALFLNPRYTSQKCSKCGYVNENNRRAF
ncbi:MAG: zinc ribbon domain-containing protein [Conexivisphaerales archaeon]